MAVINTNNGIKTVSVVILTRNRENLLKDCLESVEMQDFPHVEIVVVDNDSSDNTASMVKGNFPAVNYFKMRENIGVAARNRGVEVATGELIVMLDDDSKLMRSNTVTRIVEKFRANPGMGAAGFRIVDSNYQAEEWFVWPRCGTERRGYKSPSFLTCGAAIRPEMFERTGGFWEPYFIYVEERDLATRIINSGAEIRYFPDITILHRRDNRNRETSRLFYYLTRNSLWYFWRNFDLGTAFWKTLFFLSKQLFKAPTKERGIRYFIHGLSHAINGMGAALKSREAVKTENLILVEGKYKLLEENDR